LHIGFSSSNTCFSLLYKNNIAKENLLEIAHNPQAINHDLLSKKEKLQMPSINNSC
jgi:hypothetical protein